MDAGPLGEVLDRVGDAAQRVIRLEKAVTHYWVAGGGGGGALCGCLGWVEQGGVGWVGWGWTSQLELDVSNSAPDTLPLPPPPPRPRTNANPPPRLSPPSPPAEYFRQAVAANRGAAWPTTFLCWLKQEAGLGRVLFDALALEAVVRINRPACPGDDVWVRPTQIDVRQGLWRLEEVSPTQLRPGDVVGGAG